VVPGSRMRRAIARRMKASVVEIPQVTLHGLADAEEWLKLRARPGGRSASITALVVHTVARLLAADARLNGWRIEDEIRLVRQVHVGVAVAVEGGLVVPVIRNADELTLDEVADALRELAQKARAGALTANDMADATFSVSSLGGYRVEHFNPIVNPPQLGILGVGALSRRVIMADGTPVERSFLPLSLTFDHAAVDGAVAGELLLRLVERIEGQPAPEAGGVTR